MESLLNTTTPIIARVGLDAQQFTLDEYHYEMQNAGTLTRPSQTDFSDPLYRRKYAQSMPPLEAYRFRP